MLEDLVCGIRYRGIQVRGPVGPNGPGRQELGEEGDAASYRETSENAVWDLLRRITATSMGE